MNLIWVDVLTYKNVRCISWRTERSFPWLYHMSHVFSLAGTVTRRHDDLSHWLNQNRHWILLALPCISALPWLRPDGPFHCWIISDTCSYWIYLTCSTESEHAFLWGHWDALSPWLNHKRHLFLLALPDMQYWEWACISLRTLRRSFSLAGGWLGRVNGMALSSPECPTISYLNLHEEKLYLHN
jgi:hypothetical protein